MVDICESSLQQDCKKQTVARVVEASVSVPFIAVQRWSHTDGHVWTLLFRRLPIFKQQIIITFLSV